MTQAEVSQLREERKKLVATHAALFSQISSILFQHDPIGINFGDNPDEYDAEAGTILPRLRAGISVEDLTTIVYEEFVRWFGRDIAGPREKYSAVTAEILVAYQQSNSPSCRVSPIGVHPC